jgi:hypothetical protein
LGVAAVYCTVLFPSPELCTYNKDDSSLFVTLGINLAEHGIYTTDTNPTSESGLQATWPPGYPLFLAVLMSVFGVNWFVLKLAMALLGVVALYLLWRLFAWPEKEGQQELATWTVLITAISPMYFLLSHITMTEIPFILVTAACLLLARRIVDVRSAVAAGMGAGAAFLVRGYAIALLPSVSLFIFLQPALAKSKKAILTAAFLAPAIVSVMSWYVYSSSVIRLGIADEFTQHFGTGGTMTHAIARPLETYLRDIYWYHLRHIAHLCFPVTDWRTTSSYDGMALLGAVFAAIAAIGMAIDFRRRRSVESLWLAASIALYVLGGVNGPRYWLTHWPFMVYFFLVAVQTACRSENVGRLAFRACAMAFAVVVGIGLARHLRDPDALRFLTPYWKDFRSATVWMKDRLPDNALVVTHAPHIVYAIANVRAARSETLSTDGFRHPFLERYDNVFVCGPHHVSEDVSKFAGQFSQLHGDVGWEVVYKGSQVSIWWRRNNSSALRSALEHQTVSQQDEAPDRKDN